MSSCSSPLGALSNRSKVATLARPLNRYKPASAQPHAATALRSSRASTPWLVRGAALLLHAGLLLGAVVALLACGKAQCAGVVVDGQCEALCSDSECGSDARCVDNRCSAECRADDDCATGRCRSVRTDHGARGNYCVGGAPATNADAGNVDVATPREASAPSSSVDDPVDAGASPFVPPESKRCETNAECADPNTQTNCIAGRCVVTCLLHEHCGEIGSCTGSAVDADGANVAYCEIDEFPRGPGQYEWTCINGNENCDAEEGFRCLSRGEGDLSSYCAQLGCEDDDSCPAGYYCRHDLFSNRPPCEAACGRAGDPDHPDCVPLDSIGEGRPFRCNDTRLELRSCQRREFCNSCESDADCRGLANQVCADQGDGSKICTTLCDPDASGCPWGSASVCAVHDAELGVPTCAHQYGACSGQGAGCDPCVDDRDCPNGFCSGSTYTGEQFCVDMSAECACPAGSAFCLGGGCPLTAAGEEMNCVPGSAGEAPSICFGSTSDPNNPSSQLACWPD